MKIQSYTEEGNMLYIITDEGDFTYDKYKFKNIEELKEEIEKKILEVNLKQSRNVALNTLKEELDIEVNK